MFEFFQDLCESRLFPTVQALKNVSDKELAEWTLLCLCALRILLTVEHSHDWARVYARKTVQYGKFDRWRVDGNDLYVLLQSIDTVDSGKPIIGPGLNKQNVTNWLRLASRGEPEESVTRRLFTRMDYDLKIKNETLKSIRRQTLGWYQLNHRQKQVLFTRLLQYFRLHLNRSEILLKMEKVARHHDLELHRDHVGYDLTISKA